MVIGNFCIRQLDNTRDGPGVMCREATEGWRHTFNKFMRAMSIQLMIRYRKVSNIYRLLIFIPSTPSSSCCNLARVYLLQCAASSPSLALPVHLRSIPHPLLIIALGINLDTHSLFLSYMGGSFLNASRAVLALIKPASRGQGALEWRQGDGRKCEEIEAVVMD